MALNFNVFRNPAIKLFLNKYFTSTNRLVYLGTPVVADVDRIVTSVNMKVGTYTIAAQPDVPRNITVTHTQEGGVTDTLGTITVVGTNALDQVISEVITPTESGTAIGAVAFKTVTSITGAGWVIGTGNDTIKIGVGNYLGLPFVIDSTDNFGYGVLGTAIITPANLSRSDNVEGCYMSLSSGTYDGSKKAYINILN